MNDDQIKEITVRIKNLADVRAQSMEDVDSLLRVYHKHVQAGHEVRQSQTSTLVLRLTFPRTARRQKGTRHTHRKACRCAQHLASTQDERREWSLEWQSQRVEWRALDLSICRSVLSCSIAYHESFMNMNNLSRAFLSCASECEVTRCIARCS